jgi:hypothetical protein
VRRQRRPCGADIASSTCLREKAFALGYAFRGSRRVGERRVKESNGTTSGGGWMVGGMRTGVQHRK